MPQGREQVLKAYGEFVTGLVERMTMHSLPRLTRPCRGYREACFANKPVLLLHTGYLPVPFSLIYYWALESDYNGIC